MRFYEEPHTSKLKSAPRIIANMSEKEARRLCRWLETEEQPIGRTLRNFLEGVKESVDWIDRKAAPSALPAKEGR